MSVPGREAELEVELATMLARRRPAGGVPGRLAARVMDVPDEVRRQRPLRQLAVTVAAAAAGLLLVTVLATALRFDALPRPAASPLPTGSPVSFDARAVGLGVVTSADDMLDAAAKVGYVVGAVLAFVALARWRRLRLAAALAMAGLVVAVAWAADNHKGPVWGNAAGVGLAAEWQDPAPYSDGRPVALLTGEPNEPFAIVINVANHGALPVTVDGVVETKDARVSAPRWVAVWMTDVPHYGAPALESTRPFEPFELRPGEYAPLYLIGRTGQCALGSEQATGSSVSVTRLELAYRVLGLQSVSTFELPVIVAEPQRENCPIGGS